MLTFEGLVDSQMLENNKHIVKNIIILRTIH